MVTFEKDKLDELLRTLGDLPKIREVKALKNRLQKELEKIEKPKEQPKKSKEEIKLIANQKRSVKQKRYWRYVKLIRDNFPNLQTNEIRRQLKERRQGQETGIPDAVWQNPSP